MKRIILYFLILFLISCSKDKESNIPIDPLIDDSNIIYRLDKFGIKPSNPSEISYIGFLCDSTTYKLAGGRRNNSAWFSKFNSNGTELYNITIPSNIVGKQYTHINSSSILLLDNNKLFLRCYATVDNLNISFSDLNSIVSVYDFTSGKELCKCPSSSTSEIYLSKQNNYYFILFGKDPVSLKYSYINCINNDGLYLWGRETTITEQENGIKAYYNFQALNDSLAFFQSTGKIKIIDLKSYILKLEILERDVPYIGDKSGEQGVSCKFYKAEMTNNIINVFFDEYEETNIIDDQITGASHLVTKFLNRYYYSIKYPTGEIIGKYKL